MLRESWGWTGKTLHTTLHSNLRNKRGRGRPISRPAWSTGKCQANKNYMMRWSQINPILYTHGRQSSPLGILLNCKCSPCLSPRQGLSLCSHVWECWDQRSMSSLSLYFILFRHGPLLIHIDRLASKTLGSS